MTLKDFSQKKAHEMKTRGIEYAIRSGVQEAMMKGARPILQHRSTPIWDERWDVALVLDATRFDVFKEVLVESYDAVALNAELYDNLEHNWSVGSASPEWINETFAPTNHADIRNTGYVTANPFSGHDPEKDNILDPSVYPLRNRPLGYLDEVWADQWPMQSNLATVDPQEMTERGLWAWQHRDRLGIDKVIVHYMQPHIPFRSRPEWSAGWDLAGFGLGGGEGKDVWLQLRDGEIDEYELWNAYKDNLRWVFGEIVDWYNGTDAKILVTADHGNAMGEWGQWSHPPNSANPVLRKVPWVVIDGTGEYVRDATPKGDPPEHSNTGNGVTDRLEALGYR